MERATVISGIRPSRALTINQEIVEKTDIDAKSIESRFRKGESSRRMLVNWINSQGGTYSQTRLRKSEVRPDLVTRGGIVRGTESDEGKGVIETFIRSIWYKPNSIEENDLWIWTRYSKGKQKQAICRCKKWSKYRKKDGPYVVQSFATMLLPEPSWMSADFIWVDKPLTRPETMIRWASLLYGSSSRCEIYRHPSGKFVSLPTALSS